MRKRLAPNAMACANAKPVNAPIAKHATAKRGTERNGRGDRGNGAKLILNVTVNCSHPHLGSLPEPHMSLYRTRVERDLKRWQELGFVTEAGVGAIRGDLAKSRSAFGAAQLFALLGAVLFGFAIMSFVAANWDAMSKLARLTLLLVTLWACYAGHFLLDCMWTAPNPAVLFWPLLGPFPPPARWPFFGWPLLFNCLGELAGLAIVAPLLRR